MFGQFSIVMNLVFRKCFNITHPFLSRIYILQIDILDFFREEHHYGILLIHVPRLD